MVLRIDIASNSSSTIFVLSGRIEKTTIGELQEILASQKANQKIAFDLMYVKLIDQHSVEFLVECESRGVQLWNCPLYLREWIDRVRNGEGM